MGKPKPNAFSIYAKERQEMYRKEGFNYSMEQVCLMVGADFKALSKEEKDEYTKKAKIAKNETEKLASNRVSVEFIKKDFEEKRRQESEMKMVIENYIMTLVRRSEVAFENFYIINAIEYCYVNEKECFLPAEIAICKFNLTDGIVDKYHVICAYNELPKGYSATAMAFAEKTHRLPLPPAAQGEMCREKICEDILNFLLPNDGNKKGVNAPLPMLFTLDDLDRERNTNIKKVRDIMRDLAFDSGLSESKFKIYSLKTLFMIMNKSLGDPSGYLALPQIVAEMEKDPDAYDETIACEAHKINDAVQYCALSRSVRFAYMFMRRYCDKFNIVPIPGCHISSKVKPNDSSMMSSRASDFETTSMVSFSRCSTVKSELGTFNDDNDSPFDTDSE